MPADRPAPRGRRTRFSDGQTAFVSSLASLLIQLLHLALMIVTAPLMAGLADWLGARMRGRRAASPVQRWRRIAALLRKRPVLAESASVVSAAAPYTAAGATLAAAALVPSFTRGMILAPLADLVLVAGLLGMARCARWLAALDAGTPLGGMGMARSAPFAVVVEPVLLLCALVLAALTGRTNLDALWTAPEIASTLWAPLVLCGAALAVAVLSESAPRAAGDEETSGCGMAPGAVLAETSGRHLALWNFEAALRLLVCLSLLVALFLPVVAAGAGAGPLGWLQGLARWGSVMGAGCVLLALIGNLVPAPRPGRGATSGAAAMVLAFLGAVLLFATLRAA